MGRPARKLKENLIGSALIAMAAFVALSTPTLPAGSDVWVGYMAQGTPDGNVVIETAPVATDAECVWFNGVGFVNSGLNGTMPLGE